VSGAPGAPLRQLVAGGRAALAALALLAAGAWGVYWRIFLLATRVQVTGLIS
jgi:hypothetical protein